VPGRRSEAPSLVVTTHSEARFMSSVPAPLLPVWHYVATRVQVTPQGMGTNTGHSQHALVHVMHAAREQPYFTALEGDLMLEIQVRTVCMLGIVASGLALAA